jgi:hypothetical protein
MVYVLIKVADMTCLRHDHFWLMRFHEVVIMVDANTTDDSERCLFLFRIYGGITTAEFFVELREIITGDLRSEISEDLSDVSNQSAAFAMIVQAFNDYETQGTSDVCSVIIEGMSDEEVNEELQAHFRVHLNPEPLEEWRDEMEYGALEESTDDESQGESDVETGSSISTCPPNPLSDFEDM